MTTTASAPVGKAGAAASLYDASKSSNFAAAFPQSRILEKSESVGLIRELRPPSEYIGLRFAPFMDVASEDVTFQYAKGATAGKAPARAEDAEARLRQRDDYFTGEGRARIGDWAHKNHYRASDVNKYRDYLSIQEEIRDRRALPLDAQGVLNDFRSRVLRDTADRKLALDTTIEDLIMGSLSTGAMTYQDDKIKWTIPWGRPAGQQAQAPASGTYASDTHDPIGDINKVKQYMFKTYGIRIRRALASRAFLNSLYNSAKFLPRSGFAPGAGVDMNYVVDGWGPQAAIDIVQRNCDITIEEYDGVWFDRALGSTSLIINRFVPENRVIFLPEESDVLAYNNTSIGFAKTLTAPAPENNWTPGFYEWERETIDPWGQDIGTGIKALPVFMSMETTYTMDVTLPAV